jgi:hypothetical protein
MEPIVFAFFPLLKSLEVVKGNVTKIRETYTGNTMSLDVDEQPVLLSNSSQIMINIKDHVGVIGNKGQNGVFSALAHKNYTNKTQGNFLVSILIIEGIFTSLIGLPCFFYNLIMVINNYWNSSATSIQQFFIGWLFLWLPFCSIFNFIKIRQAKKLLD